MADDLSPYQRQLDNLNNALKNRAGDDGYKIVQEAWKRAAPNGVPQAAMEQILAQGDPVYVVYEAAKEQLLSESKAGRTESEYDFNYLRGHERDQHARLKGRR